MIVVDASVGIKWLKQDEVGADKALVYFQNHLEGKSQIVVPSLFFLEIANVLAVTKGISEKTMQDGIKLLNNSGLVLHSFTKSNLEEAALMAKRYTTTVYDMLYAVVAKENVCELVTADEKFVKLSKFGYVKLL